MQSTTESGGGSGGSDNKRKERGGSSKPLTAVPEQDVEMMRVAVSDAVRGTPLADIKPLVHLIVQYAVRIVRMYWVVWCRARRSFVLSTHMLRVACVWHAAYVVTYTARHHRRYAPRLHKYIDRTTNREYFLIAEYFNATFTVSRLSLLSSSRMYEIDDRTGCAPDRYASSDRLLFVCVLFVGRRHKRAGNYH